VRYLLIGGYAVNLHGHIRNTKAIDFWFERTPENCERLERVTRDFGVLAFDAEELLEPGMVFQTGFAPERIDLLNGAGPDFSAVYERGSSWWVSPTSSNSRSWPDAFRTSATSSGWAGVGKGRKPTADSRPLFALHVAPQPPVTGL